MRTRSCGAIRGPVETTLGAPNATVFAMRAKASVCLALLTVSFAGCEGRRETAKEREEAVGEAGTKVSVDGSIRVSPQQVLANGIQAVTLRAETLAPAISVVGRVQAQPGREAEVVSPFAGRLIASGSSLPRAGSMVKRGHVLAELEQLLTAPERTQFASQITQLEASAMQARQEVDLRQIELDRAKQLYDGGAIPLKQYQTAEFTLRQAATRLKSMQDSVAQLQGLLSQGDKGPRRIPIVAPLSGTVMASDLTAGMAS